MYLWEEEAEEAEEEEEEEDEFLTARTSLSPVSEPMAKNGIDDDLAARWSDCEVKVPTKLLVLKRGEKRREEKRREEKRREGERRDTQAFENIVTNAIKKTDRNGTHQLGTTARVTTITARAPAASSATSMCSNPWTRPIVGEHFSRSTFRSNTVRLTTREAAKGERGTEKEGEKPLQQSGQAWLSDGSRKTRGALWSKEENSSS